MPTDIDRRCIEKKSIVILKYGNSMYPIQCMFSFMTINLLIVSEKSKLLSDKHYYSTIHLTL